MKIDWDFLGDITITNGEISLSGHQKNGSMRATTRFDISQGFELECDLYFKNGFNEGSAIFDIDCPLQKYYISSIISSGIYGENYLRSSTYINDNLKTVQSDFNYLDDEWHKFYVSYNETLMEVYVDGNKISEIENPGRFESPARLSFGHNDAEYSQEPIAKNRILFRNVYINKEILQYPDHPEYQMDEIW